MVILGLGSGNLLAQELDIVPITSYYDAADFSSAAFQGDYAFLATRYGFMILDISDPGDPQEIVHMPTDGICNSVSVYGDFLFTCDAIYGLEIYDISDIDDPLLLGSLDPPGSIRKVCPLNDEILYVAAESYGLDIVDYSDPANLELINYIFVGGEAFDARVYDNWLYIGIGIAGLAVYDISMPADPVYSMIWNTFGGNCKNIYIYPDGSYLLMADLANGTHILDLTIPNIPTWAASVIDPGHFSLTACGSASYGFCSLSGGGISSFSMDGTVLDEIQSTSSSSIINEFGDFLFVSCGDSGLMVVDAGNPSNMEVRYNYFDPYRPTSMEVLGNVMYLGGITGGLHILDITNPNNPLYVDSLSITDVRDIIFSPDTVYMYVSNYQRGIEVYSLDDPFSPQYLRTIATEIDTGSGLMMIRDGYLYNSILDYGLNIFDLSDPGNPIMVYYTPERIPNFGTFALSEDGENLFSCSDVLSVFSLPEPDTVELEYEITTFETPQGMLVKDNFMYFNDAGEWVYVLDITNVAYIFKVDSITEGNYLGDGSFIGDDYMFQSKYDEGFCIFDISDPTDIFKVPGTDTETPGFVGQGLSDGDVLYITDYFDMRVFGLYGNGIEGIPQIRPLNDYTLLYPAHPNPFNAEAVISFEVFKPGKVKLSVYNINGEKITTLAEQFYQPGNYRVDFSGKSFSSGVYFARLESGGKQQTQKMMLVK